jgi:DNA mismatch endonuclease, patch repair protein
MADIYSKDKRSQVMAAVKGRDTRPERQVRKLVHGLGFRFRLHRSELPGKPDMVFPRFRKVIFIHGCFWHQHPGCRRATMPANNREFWERKLTRDCGAPNLCERRVKVPLGSRAAGRLRQFRFLLFDSGTGRPRSHKHPSRRPAWPHCTRSAPPASRAPR